ncbi:cell division control protein Cdc6 [Choiromyces venosus 120613-1]|uniref:Cell division control protein n=1 Tax=Choiromyces venosus 120613-1 TaxID=1336337 RepID=A0A3N4IY79_9PEZI|nr:cell division control protein Cdc6 [Choiromyces venosus 120613-1]
MAVVLGKRSRATSFAVVISSPRASCDRDTPQRTGAENDILALSDIQPMLDVILDEEATVAKSPKKQRRNSVQQPQPTGGRQPLSPQKLNTIFKPSKGSIEQPKQLECPKTPRHRDSVKKPVTTPRHRVSVVGKPLTPRHGKLFSPTSVTATPTSVLTTAKALFSRSSAPGRLIGRDDEKKQLTEFLQPRISSRSGGCLYVSGPPGCGKSALLSEVMTDLGADKSETVKTAYVNCMAIKDPKGIYSKLLEEFFAEETLSSSTGMEDLERLFINKKKTKKTAGNVYVVVLDEIDHLLTKDQEVLYSIFEWSLMRGSQLILLGIANALDLTDRFLPRLKARNLTPQLLPFLPYSAPQIAAVITSRLRSLLPDGNATPGNFVPFMHPAAIQLAARKVAGATGDLRKVFDICRRAVELVELETRQKELKMKQQQQQEEEPKSLGEMMKSPARQPLMENMNLNSPRVVNSTLSSLTIETAPRATIAHVARVSSSSFGGSSITRVKMLNLQQKAVLCCLTTTEKSNGSVTIRKLFDVYTALCKKERLLHPLSSTEFRDVVASLEVAGVVNMAAGGMGTPSKRGRASGGTEEKRISACVREMDLLTAVADVGPILTKLFSDSK